MIAITMMQPHASTGKCTLTLGVQLRARAWFARSQAHCFSVTLTHAKSDLQVNWLSHGGDPARKFSNLTADGHPLSNAFHRIA